MNCFYSLACFCSDTNDILNKILCLVCTCFQYLLYKCKKHSKFHLNSHPIKNLLTFASWYLVKCRNFYTQWSLETVFPALKLAQICCINMNISFLENWQFSHNLTKYENKRNSKIPIFQLFSELWEIWLYSLS